MCVCVRLLTVHLFRSTGLPEDLLVEVFGKSLGTEYGHRFNYEALKLCARGRSVLVCSQDAGSTDDGHGSDSCAIQVSMPLCSNKQQLPHTYSPFSLCSQLPVPMLPPWAPPFSAPSALRAPTAPWERQPSRHRLAPFTRRAVGSRTCQRTGYRGTKRTL